MSFRSNVAQPRFGAGSTTQMPWVCERCGRANREYMTRCAECGAYPGGDEVEPPTPLSRLIPSEDDPNEWVVVRAPHGG